MTTYYNNHDYACQTMEGRDRRAGRGGGCPPRGGTLRPQHLPCQPGPAPGPPSTSGPGPGPAPRLPNFHQLHQKYQQQQQQQQQQQMGFHQHQQQQHLHQPLHPQHQHQHQQHQHQHHPHAHPHPHPHPQQQQLAQGSHLCYSTATLPASMAKSRAKFMNLRDSVKKSPTKSTAKVTGPGGARLDYPWGKLSFDQVHECTSPGIGRRGGGGGGTLDFRTRVCAAHARH